MRKILFICFTALVTVVLYSASARAQAKPVTWNNPNIANGPANIEHHSFKSLSMDEEVGYTIYLPPGYENGKDSYPVIYFLHGVQGNEWNYHNSADSANSLPNLIESGKLPPTIVVFPNGGAFLNYINAPGSCAQTKACPETMIISELIPEIDNKFRTIANKEGRAIEGFSMGGIGASYYATKYPELFSSAASMSSGCWLIDTCTQVQNDINANAISAGGNKPAFMLSYGSETGKIVNWQNDLYGLLSNQGYSILPVSVLFGIGHDLGAQLSYTPSGSSVSFGLSLGLFHWDHFGVNQFPNPTITPQPTPTATPTPLPSPTGVPSPTPVPSPTIQPTPSPSISPRPSRSPRPSPSTRPGGRQTLTQTERMAADLDRSERVDERDFSLLREYFGAESCEHNITGDCRIDIFDYNALYEVYRGQ